ncbi:hypothetical protein LAZ40_09375 [Cereibacter sphaeroides]|uniref:hypothetical protein n=1 Tax=Cereibacter sphaeroides TaxID=1063 RepID=UPI001F25BA6D|nr:hypothetical protein [Cereibacter sphaeroides]MCE6959262.1 hypothetical protein [Cereibacter sphaeroides]MCE6971256.1 hypothetical protein [Cereibacter sphaeroides]
MQHSIPDVPPLDPARGATPIEELRLLETHLKALGQAALIEIEGKNGGSVISAELSGPGPEIDQGLAERLMLLAPYLLEADMPGWDQDAGSTGRLRLSGDGEPWLDAVDRNEDWLLERTIDLEALEGRDWDEAATLVP